MTNPHQETIKAALRVLLDYNAASVALAAHDMADGIDARLSTLSRLAETAAGLARLTSATEQQVADSHLRAMEYGDALHALLTARAASEYACHIEAAHEASAEAQNTADGLAEGDEDEPETAEAFAEACRAHGLNR